MPDAESPDPAAPPERPLFDAQGGRSARRALWTSVAILAAAVALRVWFAGRKGLVLDEFHSYFHATRESLGALLETLRLDNHPPLSFLVIRASRALFGDGELALRLPAILFGTAELVLVWRIARRLGRRSAAAWVAMALLACSSLHLDFSTQARMYALHALAVTGLVEALGTLLATPAGEPARAARVRVGVWIAVGLLNHYFFLQYLFWIAAALTLTALTAPPVRERATRALLPAALAVALCLPWYLWGFRAQLAHDLSPGGDDVGLVPLAEAFVHLFYLNVRIGGPALRLVFIACGGLACALAAVGWLRLVRAGRPASASEPTRETPPVERALPLLLFAVAFLVPVAAALTAAVFPRAGFTWHYVLPSAAAMAVLLGAAAGGGSTLLRAGVAIVGAGALLLSLLNASARGSEDYPGAVRTILAEQRPGDAVIAVEWQPPVFPQGQPWNYYAPRLVAAGSTPPTPLELNQGLDLARPRELESSQRVLLLRTSLPGDQRLMQRLRDGYVESWSRNFGFGVDVLLFEARD